MKNATVGPSEWNVTRSVRISHEMSEELERIALFEAAKEGTLLRMFLQDRILGYLSNPRYKRWLKKYEESQRTK